MTPIAWSHAVRQIEKQEKARQALWNSQTPLNLHQKKKENKIVTEIYDFDAQLIEIIGAKNAPYPIYYFHFQSFFSWSFQAVYLVTFFTILWLSMPAYLQRPRQTAILQL